MTHMSGIRRSELAALDIPDVLNMNGEVKTEVQLPNRTLVLPKQLQKELQAYIAEQFELTTLNCVAHTHKGVPLFFTQKQHAFSPTSLSQVFTAIYKRAGIEGTTKTGRQTWLNTLLVRGANTKAVKVLAGQTRLTKAVQPNPAILRAVAEMI